MLSSHSVSQCLARDLARNASGFVRMPTGCDHVTRMRITAYSNAKWLTLSYVGVGFLFFGTSSIVQRDLQLRIGGLVFSARRTAPLAPPKHDHCRVFVITTNKLFFRIVRKFGQQNHAGSHFEHKQVT